MEVRLLQSDDEQSNRFHRCSSLWKVTTPFAYLEICLTRHEADLHQIIRSGQTLTNEHVQYFTYQILRGRMQDFLTKQRLNVQQG
jgi:hypothetical protein